MQSGANTGGPDWHLAGKIEAISLLDDPMRRNVYFSVPPSPSFADRDHVASSLGIRRNLAAFHLDKLADRGLLTVTYRRVSGKTGRGAGRPRKFYQRSEREIEVSIPERNYGLMALLLATALEGAGQRSKRRLVLAARGHGARLGHATVATAGSIRSRGSARAALLKTLVNEGYEPDLKDKAVYMRNCPFHAVAAKHRDLVCSANTALMTGLTDSVDSAGLAANYEPAEDRCCVVLRPTVRGEPEN
jgi:predicted ArsR family transcriptional regulator